MRVEGEREIKKREVYGGTPGSLEKFVAQLGDLKVIKCMSTRA